MGNSTKRDNREFELLENEKQAIELRKCGASLEQIARALGYKNRSQAYKLLQRAREKWSKQNAASVEVLVMESRATLEGLKFSIADKVRRGELAAIDRAIRIEERLASLLGLDAPKRQEFVATVTSGGTPEEAARLVREAFGERAAQRQDAGAGAEAIPEGASRK